MPTQLDLKRRIRSVRNTQQITRAMKFVAAARLRRAQERALSLRPYAKALDKVIRSAVSRIPEGTHPLLEKRDEKRVLLLVVSGERGLCGAFNANVLRRAVEFLRGRPSPEGAEVMALGRKGRDSLRKQRWTMTAEYTDIGVRVQSERAAEITKAVMERYQAGEVDAVYIVFNEFKSVLTQVLRLEKLLPIEPTASGAESEGGAAPVDYLYEQPVGEMLERLLPRYVEVQIYRALAESAAAEHAARMTAMDSATRNARELIDKLTLYMNKVRQAVITKEIIEVVSGAASAG
jgi:F-type H+-transporting ATPase subunit gamma